jgi:hypothetical protein
MLVCVLRSNRTLAFLRAEIVAKDANPEKKMIVI